MGSKYWRERRFTKGIRPPVVPRQSFRRPYWWILTLVIWHSFAMLVSKQEMLARVPLTIRIGLGLVLAGVAWTGAWAWWASAGNTMWVPLDVQIPASLGHRRTPFKLHVESTYRIFIAVGRQVNSDGVPCITSPLCGNALPRAEWSLSSVQRVITGGSSDSNGGEVYDTDVKWRELGMFQAAGGNYVVDVDLVGDGRAVSGRELCGGCGRGGGLLCGRGSPPPPDVCRNRRLARGCLRADRRRQSRVP